VADILGVHSTQGARDREQQRHDLSIKALLKLCQGAIQALIRLV
jgi:hypothetical protein